MLPVGSAALAFLSGLLSILSPCVLPILPLALGGAVSAHRLGPLALAAGLALSFTAIGLFVATLGFSLGLGGGAFQMAGAMLFVILGTVLMVPQLQARFATAAGPLGNWVDARFGTFSTAGLTGQFGLGLLFGAVWSPCAGPTLGAAAALAAGGHDLGQVTLVMLAFGIGAALPLIALGMLSRASLLRWRGTLANSGTGAKMALGAVLIVFGGLVLTGLNQPLETLVVSHSPGWLLQLTTKY